ncbi:MAG: hypothetical protein HC906_01460 [Bacteroidales bacterium]|nr:hypothetical protein [Bacteroidales bacterium]
MKKIVVFGFFLLTVFQVKIQCQIDFGFGSTFRYTKVINGIRILNGINLILMIIVGLAAMLLSGTQMGVVVRI